MQDITHVFSQATIENTTELSTGTFTDNLYYEITREVLTKCYGRENDDITKYMVKSICNDIFDKYRIQHNSFELISIDVNNFGKIILHIKASKQYQNTIIDMLSYISMNPLGIYRDCEIVFTF